MYNRWVLARLLKAVSNSSLFNLHLKVLRSSADLAAGFQLSLNTFAENAPSEVGYSK